MPAAGVVPRLFDRAARHYDTAWLQRALYTALQDRALAELRAGRFGAVLDVGCGTGIFTARLDREVVPGGVFGCDLSAGMLAEAAARRPGVGWVRGDSARLPVRSGAVDAVVCTQAFHFFDQPAAWAEFRRVLAPGGLAVVGMVHPRTTAGSRRLSALSSALSGAALTWPTAAGMRSMAADAGFEVAGQHGVEWRFRSVAPLVVTVGRVPSV